MDEPCHCVHHRTTRGQYTSTIALKPRDCTFREKIPTLSWLILLAKLFHMLEIITVYISLSEIHRFVAAILDNEKNESLIPKKHELPVADTPMVT